MEKQMTKQMTKKMTEQEIKEQENLVSECAEIQENVPICELEEFAKIKEVVEGLNQAHSRRLKVEGFTNECFFNEDGSLTKEQSYNIKEKKKYFYIDLDGSGIFMVEKTTGNIFNIKSYGTINRAKLRGNVGNIDASKLYQLK